MNTGGAFVAGSIVGKLLLDKTGWNASIKSVDKDKKSLNGMAASIGSGFVQVAKMATVAGIAAAGALAVIVKKTADAGDAVWDMSQRTGIATETLSGLKLAAEKSGTSIEGVAVGLRFLGRSMVNASDGVKTSSDAFADLSISVKDAEGKLRPMQDVMLDVADRFAGMENGAEKTALAIKLFGRSGTELIPMLNLGAEGLRKEIEMAEKLGLVFTEKTAKAADKFKDTMTELNGALAGMRNDIGNALIPVFTKLAAGVTEALTYIRSKVAEFAESGKLQEWAIVAARGFIAAFKLMAKSVEGLMLIFPSLKAAIFSVAEGFYSVLSKIAEGVSLIPGVSAQASVALKVWAADLKDFSATYGKAADYNIERASDIVAGFDVLTDALDMVSAGFGKAGLIAKKTFKEMATASGVSVDEMAANLEKLTNELESVAGMAIVEVPIEFDFSNLDAAIPPDFMTDIFDGAARAAADASQKIRDSIASLTAGGTIGETKNKIAEIELALTKTGLTAAKVRELKDELARLKSVVADSTPWGKFTDAALSAVSKIQQAYQYLGTAMSAVVNQAQVNAEIAIENEYKKRLDYINKTVTNEDAKQKAVMALEAEYEIKKSAARAKGAKAAKAMSIMEAMVNTAVAVTSALKVFPPWLGIALAAVVGALGAVQVGLIAAQPIPLAEGASFEKPTLLQNVLVGEKRPEYLLDKPKLTDIVRDALMPPAFMGAPAMAMAGAGGGGQTINATLNFHTTGLSRRDLELAGDDLLFVIQTKLRGGRRL
jgi:hypothetical protein